MHTKLPLGLLLLATLSGCPQGSPPTSATPPARTEAAGFPAAETSSAPAASASSSPVQGDFTIVPGQGFGPIAADSTQASLEQQFGKEQVRAGEIPGAEGIMLPGLSVFPDQPDKNVRVFLTEDQPKRISHVEIGGEKSQWKTAQGITLGTPLAELEKLNGKPFELMGLGWDYGGFVTDWKGGALEGLSLRLNSTASDLTDEETSSISGDQTISSDLPALRKANPTVSQISVMFSDPIGSPTSGSTGTPEVSGSASPEATSTP